MQVITLRVRYSPRASRVGVLSNFLAVSARACGPTNGRHPIVKVIPAAKTTASATNIQTRSFPIFFILWGIPLHLKKEDHSIPSRRTLAAMGIGQML
jgi:hypothetical protein